MFQMMSSLFPEYKWKNDMFWGFEIKEMSDWYKVKLQVEFQVEKKN